MRSGWKRVWVWFEAPQAWRLEPLKLEANAEAKLHRPRGIGTGIVRTVALTRQVAKTPRTAESDANRIKKLEMVQDVCEDNLELGADPLCN